MTRAGWIEKMGIRLNKKYGRYCSISYHHCFYTNLGPKKAYSIYISGVADEELPNRLSLSWQDLKALVAKHLEEE